jgi:anti-sigma regulatory factor (Ser/Thr protein kinase)
VSPSRRPSSLRVADERGQSDVPLGEPLWVRRFAFPATSVRVPAARHRVERSGLEAGLRGNALFELVLAVGEGLSNAVKHGSPHGARDTVTVTVSCYRDAFSVEIADEGPGLLCSPLHQPGASSVEGRGIHVMRRLTDDIGFECTGGTHVLLVKLIPRLRAR